MENSEFMRRYREERNRLDTFLNRWGFSLDSFPVPLDRCLSSLVVMRYYIDAGLDVAKTRDLGAFSRIMGRGAKVEKDNVYGGLAQDLGVDLMEIDFDDSRIIGVKDYIMEKFDDGVNAGAMYLRTETVFREFGNSLLSGGVC